MDGPQALAELIAYQSGAIVSRTLVKQPGGNVTLFAFDAGQGLSEHTAPFDAFAQVIDGAADISIGGAAYTVTAGQALLLPANVPHALRATKPFKMLLTMIRA
jgi:quercetin dioxygenase-like cupin family protein